MWVTIQRVCNNCSKTVTLKVDSKDKQKWERDGVCNKDVFPYLTDDEREILISGTCGECFDKLFPQTDDEWDEEYEFDEDDEMDE